MTRRNAWIPEDLGGFQNRPPSLLLDLVVEVAGPGVSKVKCRS